jgi:hypothetical protein
MDKVKALRERPRHHISAIAVSRERPQMAGIA